MWGFSCLSPLLHLAAPIWTNHRNGFCPGLRGVRVAHTFASAAATLQPPPCLRGDPSHEEQARILVMGEEERGNLRLQSKVLGGMNSSARCESRGMNRCSVRRCRIQEQPSTREQENHGFLRSSHCPERPCSVSLPRRTDPGIWRVRCGPGRQWQGCSKQKGTNGCQVQVRLVQIDDVTGMREI